MNVRAEIYDGSKHFLKYFLSKFEKRESHITNLKYFIFYFKRKLFSLLHRIIFLMYIYLLTSVRKKKNDENVNPNSIINIEIDLTQYLYK